MQSQGADRDPVLPGLERVADPQSVRDLLSEHFNSGTQIESVSLHYGAYRPQRTARFVYELALRDGSGERHTHFMHGWLGDVDRMRERHLKLRERSWTPPRFGPAFLYFPELGFLVFGFPNDPKLRFDVVADPSRLLATLKKLPGVLPQSTETCVNRVVRYVPRKRCVILHIFEPGTQHVYTKTYAHDRGPAVFRILEHLWKDSREHAQAFAIPQPLAFLPETQTLVQEGLQGWRDIEDDLPAQRSTLMAMLGRGLAHLHASELPQLGTWEATDEMELFIEATDSIRRFVPRLTPELDAVCELARRRAHDLVPSEHTTIHGAFRLKQLLTNGDRVALVDLDGVARGDPMSDLGSLLAQLQARVIARRFDPSTARECADMFIHAYCCEKPEKFRSSALAWYAGLRIISKHALGQVRHLKPDASGRIQALIEVSKRTLETGTVTFE